MIERSSALDTGLKIISHEYDHLWPTPVGLELFDWIPVGPSWLYPYMARKGIKDGDLQRDIVKTILIEFSVMMAGLEKEYQNFHVAKTQGTLVHSAEWRNEIHPTSLGFQKISYKMKDLIRKL